MACKQHSLTHTGSTQGGGTHRKGTRGLSDVPEAVRGEDDEAAGARRHTHDGRHVRRGAQAQVAVLEELIAQAARQVEPIQPRAARAQLDAHACSGHHREGFDAYNRVTVKLNPLSRMLHVRSLTTHA